MDREREIENFLLNEFDFDNCRYFYHITSSGYGRKIMDEGLLLQEPSLKTTTIEFTPDILDDLGRYIVLEYNNSNSVKRDEMVILGIPYDKVDSVIEISNDEIPYVINNKYIMGYIDLESLEFNENFEYGFGNQL